MATSDPGPKSTPAEPDRDGGFDQVIAKLRGVVEKLEAGSLGLEQALGAFEEGVRLSRRGAEILEQAERRVEILTRSVDGAPQAVPFDTGEGDGTT
jgi:exodeoxyribonuclease VII small subunit